MGSRSKIMFNDFFEEGLTSKMIELRKELETIKADALALKKVYPARVENSKDIDKIQKARQKLNDISEKHRLTQLELLKVEQKLAEQQARQNKEVQEKTALLNKEKEVARAATKEAQAQARAEAQLEKERQKAANAAAKQAKKERELVDAANMQVKSIEDLRKKTNALMRVRDRLDLTTKKGREEFDKYTAAIKRNNDTLLKAESAAGRHFRNVGNYRSAFGAIGGFGSRVLGAFGITAGLYGAVTATKEMIKTQAEFEQKMAQVRAVANATEPELKKLELNAKELGRTTLFTAGQIATLQYELAKLGFTTDEIINSTDAIQNLSAATLEDFTKTATIAGTTLRGFQLDAKEMARVTDVMAQSFNMSGLDLDKFAESMKYVAPVAKASGVSLEYVSAMLSALSDAGISGSMAGTSLRRILTEMSIKGKTAAEALDDLNKRGIDLADSMDEVGRYAQTSLLVLVNNKDKIETLNEAYKNAAGSAENMAKIQRDTLSSSITLLASAWDGLILRLEKVEKLKGAVDWITDLLNKISGSFKNETISYIEEEQIKVYQLVSEYTNLSTTLEVRKDILQKLKQISPKIVDGIEAETTNYEKLTENVIAYTEAVTNRLAQEKMKEEEGKVSNDLFKSKAEFTKLKGEFQTLLIKINKEIAFDPALSENEKAEKAKEFLEKQIDTLDTFGNKLRGNQAEMKNLTDLWADAAKFDRLQKDIQETGKVIDQLTEKQTTFLNQIADLSNAITPAIVEAPAKVEESLNLKILKVRDLYDLMEKAKAENQDELVQMIDIEIKKRREVFERRVEHERMLNDLELSNQDKLIKAALEKAKNLSAEALKEIIYKIDYKVINEEEARTLDALEKLYTEGKIKHSDYEKEKFRISERYSNLRRITWAQEVGGQAGKIEADKQIFEIPEEEEAQDSPELLRAIATTKETSDFRLKILETEWKNGEIGWQEYQNRVNEIMKEGEKENTRITKTESEKRQEIIQGVSSILSTLSQALTTQYVNEESNKLEALEKRFDRGLISEAEYNSEKSKIEREYAQKDKERQITAAKIQGVQVILNALSTQPWWVGLAQAFIAEIMIAEQISQIRRQKYATGEVDIKGKKHSEGGIPVEIEGGESVISAKATQKARGTLELINSGKLTDVDILPYVGKNMSFVGVGNTSPDNKLHKYQEKLIEESEKTNRLLSKFKHVSNDGTTFTDIHGNKTIYK